MNIIKLLLGSANDRIVKSYDKTVSLINDLEQKYHAMSDEELRGQTEILKKRLADGEKEKAVLPDAFAVVREAAIRSLGMRHFDVQLIGGMVLANGQISEMKTGEGKTLVATLALYLKALYGKGAHLITVNDYLASRDAQWMGQVYKFLGLTVGIIQHDMSDEERRAAYNCDITYVTNSELGFDYLRDNMKFFKEQQVLRPLFYGIVDEVDSILIDEARTPLIISGPSEDVSELYNSVDAVVAKFGPDDFKKDEKDRHVTLTESGVDTATRLLKEAGLLAGDNLYASENAALVMHIQQSLLAHHLYQKNVNYVVRNGEVLIVDEFTGRVMTGRRFGRGLHQAIEAKEHVTVQPENQTVSSISYQNLFRLYETLAGMTGTAMTEAAEFEEIYKLRVVSIPTNRPVARIDHHDEIYRNKAEKYDAILKQIKDCVDRKQPVLVGTVSIEKSEELAALVREKLGLNPAVLNAKHHESEAKIVAQAGAPGAVTIATNMAGRGTDIKLTDETKALGGLYVIGTERHESRRIDNQLRGRSGRQGDPGASQFYVSMEDDLMVRFGTDKVKGMLKALGMQDDQAIRSKTFTKSIGSAQAKVEGNNFDIRKQLLEYDDVMNQQREDIYRRRNEILDNESIHETVLNTIYNHIADVVNEHIPPENILTSDDLNDIANYVNQNLLRKDIKVEDLNEKTPEEVIEFINDKVVKEYEKKLSDLPEEIRDEFEKAISLNVIDKYWTENINALAHLREAVMMRGYGGQDPLRAYSMDGVEMYENMLVNIDKDITLFLLKAEVKQNIERKEVVKNKLTNDKDETTTRTQAKSKKVGRNDPCPCGSGKKYKQCCGK